MNRELVLKRIAHNGNGTFGVLLEDGHPFAVTLENQWRDNARDISCIPAGTYICQRVQSPRFGDTFEVMAVPNRSYILFHSGNTEDDTRGCILLGKSYGSLKGKTAILTSRLTVQSFMKRLEGKDTFTLTIREA